MTTKIVCPHCQQSDRVERVSAVFKSQTQSDGYRVKATALAVSLMPPSQPELKVRATGALMGPQRKSCLGEAGFMSNILLFLLFGLVLMGIGLSFSNLFCVLVGGAMLAFDVYYVFSSQNKLKHAEDSHAEDMDGWRQQVAEWEQLYYCYRDDVVFDPRSGQSADTGSIATLYQHA